MKDNKKERKNVIKKAKRKSIRKRLRSAVLIISILSIVVVSVIGVIAINNIRSTSQKALIEQMSNNIINITEDKVDLATSGLQKYKDAVEEYARTFSYMYENKDLYVPRPIGVYKGEPTTDLVLQRNIVDENIDVSKIQDEMYLLANIEKSWIPMMKRESDVITSVYAGAESGFMLSYDGYVSYAEPSENGEVYFNHKERPWYLAAKEKGETIFTNLEQDAFGKGLTLTCATPFYNKGSFAGVVSMDILVTNLQREIIDINIGQGGYAFIVDSKGDIVASPFVSTDVSSFENVSNENSKFYEVRNELIGERGGITKLADNTYLAYEPVRITDWMFCVSVPESLVLKPVKDINIIIRNILIVFIISFVIIGIIVAAIVNTLSLRLSKPILSLENEVKEISNGNLDKKVSVIGNDEISDLAIAFNNMTDSLKKYINDLTSMTAEKERIGAELNVATHIQSSMLPVKFPENERFELYASMTPAKEVGGDFYDFFKIDDTHLAIVMADVSGKGVPAALFMVIGKTLIKDHTLFENNYLDGIFANVNNLLCEANSEGLFITAFEAVIDLETGEMDYVNAGHEMPFICRKGQDFVACKMDPDFVLAGFEENKYTMGHAKLEKGDKLFQYTDGVTEATDAKNQLFGMDRLKEVLDKYKDKTPKEILEGVKKGIDTFVKEAPQFDDITMLCVEYKG